MADTEKPTQLTSAPNDSRGPAPERLERKRQSSGRRPVAKAPGPLLLAAIAVAGIGWGVAIAAWSTVPKRADPITPLTSVPSAQLAAELQTRERELYAVATQYRRVTAELDAARHNLARRPMPQPSAVRATGQSPAEAAALRAARARLDTQTLTVADLRRQLADVRGDNAGFEQNYRDLLAALHRSQNEIYADRRRLAAASNCRPTSEAPAARRIKSARRHA